MGMKIVCIDFETANSFSGSICAMGIAVAQDGKITDKYYTLVKPHERYHYFSRVNTAIHGITSHDVCEAPEFDEVYGKIGPLLCGSVAAAHNAAFDMGALRHVLDLYGIAYPNLDYICTCKAARKAWGNLENYKLDTVCAHLNFRFKHHNAQEDAEACAVILLQAMKKTGSASPYELAEKTGLKMGRLFDGGYIPCGTGTV